MSKEIIQLVFNTLPNITVFNNTVYRDGKMLFHSDNNQCVEAFLMGMIFGKTSK
jgi:hypothetical protein